MVWWFVGGVFTKSFRNWRNINQLLLLYLIQFTSLIWILCEKLLFSFSMEILQKTRILLFFFLLFGSGSRFFYSRPTTTTIMHFLTNIAEAWLDKKGNWNCDDSRAGSWIAHRKKTISGNSLEICRSNNLNRSPVRLTNGDVRNLLYLSRKKEAKPRSTWVDKLLLLPPRH